MSEEKAPLWQSALIIVGGSAIGWLMLTLAIYYIVNHF